MRSRTKSPNQKGRTKRPLSEPLARNARAPGEIEMPGSKQTAAPVLTERQIQEAIADCLPYLLRLLPKAIQVFEDTLDSGNPRSSMAAATRLLETIGVFGSRGNEHIRETAAALEQRDEEKTLITYGLLSKMCFDKAERYKMSLPPDLAWLAPRMKEIEQQIADRRKNNGNLDAIDPEEIPPLQGYHRRD